jgi:hypothetical protein
MTTNEKFPRIGLGVILMKFHNRRYFLEKERGVMEQEL